MRNYSWRVATAAMVLLYPTAYLAKYLVDFVGLKLSANGTLADQVQFLHLGTTAFVTVALFGWFIAFYAGLASMRGDDADEVRQGRFAFTLVLVTTALYVAAMVVPTL